MNEKKTNKENSYHHSDLKSDLVSVARQLLEEDGPEALSFREIARQIGVSRSAPYSHFQSKKHLLATVARDGFYEFIDFLNSNHDHEAEPKQKIFELSKAYLVFSRSHPQLYRLMFGVGIANWKDFPDAKEAAEKSYEPLKAVVRDFYGADHPEIFRMVETTSLTIWSTLHGLSMLMLDGKLNPGNLTAETAEETTRRVAKWLISGLSAVTDDIFEIE